MRPQLDVGDVVRCTTIKRDYLGDDNKPILQAGFKAGRGKRFMFVMIGVEDSKSPWTDLDVKQALRAIGLHSSEDQESAEAELARLRGPAYMPLMRTNMAIRMRALNEDQARSNHNQTLARLAERGGLSPKEALAIIERREWRSGSSEKEALEVLMSMAEKMPAKESK